MMTLSLKDVAKWEYKTLKNEANDWNYPGGFDAWFSEVFMIDEAWQEIRENYQS